MKKDAYFFPHFSNARHDRKLKRVIKELGVEGYGIYFMLLEVLREQIDFKYPLNDIDLLADEFNTSEQKVRTIISNYQLFDVNEDDQFFSMKLVFYMQPYIEKSERARTAANKRWDTTKEIMKISGCNANAYANALPEQSDSTANAMQGEERRGEETKGEKRKGETRQLVESPSSRLDFALYDFVEFRKGIKKPMSAKALELLKNQLNKLAQTEEDQIEILNQSIVNGWQGVFELKNKPQGKKDAFWDQAERMREW